MSRLHGDTEPADPAIAQIMAMRHLTDDQKRLFADHLSALRREVLVLAERLNYQHADRSSESAPAQAPASTPTKDPRGPRYATRLDEYMDRRRLELNKTWQEVADDAGVTVTTVNAIRKGDNRPTAKTARGIDKALHWQATPSSTLAVFHGGKPVPLSEG